MAAGYSWNVTVETKEGVTHCSHEKRNEILCPLLQRILHLEPVLSKEKEFLCINLSKLLLWVDPRPH